MSKPKHKEQKQARILRRKGRSVNEISGQLNVSKGSVSAWTKNVQISEEGLKRIRKRSELGRKRASATHKKKRKEREAKIEEKARKFISIFSLGINQKEVLCALLYWCEGESKGERVVFTNSDPMLVRLFLSLVREVYDVDEGKFRVCMHLHDYHNEDKQKRFWSRITNIPCGQFTKTFKKKKGSKRIRENYPGCVSIRYGNATIARRMNAIAKSAMKKYGSIV